MQKLYLTLTLVSLCGLVAAAEDLHALFNDAVGMTKKIVDQKQLDDITGVRRELEQVADSHPDELLQKAYGFQYEASIDKYLASGKHVVDRETFDSSLEKSCRALKEIWTPFIDYCLKRNLNLLTLSDVKTRDATGYEMFLNAGLCYDLFSVRQTISK